MSGRTFGYCFHSLYELIGLLFTVALAFLQGVKRAILGPFLKRPLHIVSWRTHKPPPTISPYTNQAELYTRDTTENFLVNLQLFFFTSINPSDIECLFSQGDL